MKSCNPSASNHFSNVVCQSIVVVASPRLIRIAESPDIHSEAAIAHFGKLIKLVFKQLMVCRPTVYKQDCLSARRVDILYKNVYIRLNSNVMSHANSSIDKSLYRSRVHSWLQMVKREGADGICR